MYVHADCINGLETVTFGCVCVQCTGPPPPTFCLKTYLLNTSIHAITVITCITSNGIHGETT